MTSDESPFTTPTNQFIPNGTNRLTNANATTSSQYQQNLINIDIADENVALNVMVSFLNVAQKRGAFDLAESAKIWECVQKFIVTQQQQQQQR
jgi:hypothetical protein